MIHTKKISMLLAVAFIVLSTFLYSQPMTAQDSTTDFMETLYSLGSKMKSLINALREGDREQVESLLKIFNPGDLAFLVAMKEKLSYERVLQEEIVE